MKNLYLHALGLVCVFTMFACGGEYDVKKPFCKQSFELAHVEGKTATYQGEKSSGCQRIVGNQELVSEDLHYKNTLEARDDLNLAIASMVVTSSDPKQLEVKVIFANPSVEKGNVKNRRGSDMMTEADNVEDLAPFKISVLVSRH